MDHIISISPDGTVRTLYTDRINLRDFGTLDVKRASNVEYDNKEEGWVVTLSDGRFIARDPHRSKWVSHEWIKYVFETREDALAAEVDYLQARL